jgi:hypothetical protein
VKFSYFVPTVSLLKLLVVVVTCEYHRFVLRNGRSYCPSTACNELDIICLLDRNNSVILVKLQMFSWLPVLYTAKLQHVSLRLLSLCIADLIRVWLNQVGLTRSRQIAEHVAKICWCKYVVCGWRRRSEEVLSTTGNEECQYSGMFLSSLYQM